MEQKIDDLRSVQPSLAGRLGRLSLTLFVCSLSSCASVKALIGNRSDRCDQLCREARSAQQQGNMAQAAKLFDQAVAANPQDAETRWERAQLLWQSGRISEATTEFRRVVAQNPNDPRGLTYLARILYEQQQDLEASQLASRALELDPQNVEALLVRARLEERHGDHEAALASYHRISQIDHGHVDAALGVAAIQLKRGSPDRAAPLLREVIQNTSRTTPAQRSEAAWMLGLAYGQSERWADSAAALSSAIEQRNATADDWYRLAFASYRAGDLDGARDGLQEALRLDSRHPPARAMAANLLSLPPEQSHRWQEIMPAAADAPNPWR